MQANHHVIAAINERFMSPSEAIEAAVGLMHLADPWEVWVYICRGMYSRIRSVDSCV